MTTIERDSKGKSNAADRYSIMLLLAIAIGITFFSLYLVWLLQWQGPFRDLWEFVPDIEKQFRGEWSFAYLIDAYGGAHRIFFPKLLFFADWYWFGGRNILTIIVAISCQLVYLGIILRAAAQQRFHDTWDQKLITATFLLALFSTTQVSNFLYAMDVQWYMSNLLAVMALATLVRNPAKPLRFLMLGICAALCNFTGLISLIIGSIWLMTQTPGKRASWVTMLATSIVCVLYINNPNTTEHTVIKSLHSASSITDAIKTIAGTFFHMSVYLLRYLSSPLSREWTWLGTLLSIAVILTLSWYWLQNWRKGLSTFQSLCLLIASCIVLSGIATAFGRMIFPNSAIAERYQTLVLPLLPAIIALVLPDIRRWPQIPGQAIACLVFGLYLLPAQFRSAEDIAILSNRVHQAHTAARAGVLEKPYTSATLSHPLLMQNINMVKLSDPFLRNQQLGYFNLYQNRQLGDQWPSIPLVLPTCSDNVQSTLDQATRVWTLQGLLSPTIQLADDMILVQTQTLTGFGLFLRPEGFLLPLEWLPAHKRLFRVYAMDGLLDASHTATLYAFAGNTPVCQQRLLLK